VSFEEGIRSTVEWYRAHEGWWKKIKSGEFSTYYVRNCKPKLAQVLADDIDHASANQLFLFE
jgi:dTDP-glucose 4,6-dehydratase